MVLNLSKVFTVAGLGRNERRLGILLLQISANSQATLQHDSEEVDLLLFFDEVFAFAELYHSQHFQHLFNLLPIKAFEDVGVSAENVEDPHGLGLLNVVYQARHPLQ